MQEKISRGNFLKSSDFASPPTRVADGRKLNLQKRRSNKQTDGEMNFPAIPGRYFALITFNFSKASLNPSLLKHGKKAVRLTRKVNLHFYSIFLVFTAVNSRYIVIKKAWKPSSILLNNNTGRTKTVVM